jgi:hypothetical protein
MMFSIGCLKMIFSRKIKFVMWSQNLEHAGTTIYSSKQKKQVGDICRGRRSTATVRPRKMSSDATRFAFLGSSLAETGSASDETTWTLCSPLISFILSFLLLRLNTV